MTYQSVFHLIISDYNLLILKTTPQIFSTLFVVFRILIFILSFQGNTLKLLSLEQNEAAFSVALLKFHGQPDHQLYLVVGVARDLQLNPRLCNSGFLATYRILDTSEEMLELVHKTPVDEVPTALCSYNGRLLAGVGRLLRLYDLGKKKLLRKCENKVSTNFI